jgi:hypothetical protein
VCVVSYTINHLPFMVSIHTVSWHHVTSRASRIRL